MNAGKWMVITLACCLIAGTAKNAQAADPSNATRRFVRRQPSATPGAAAQPTTTTPSSAAPLAPALPVVPRAASDEDAPPLPVLPPADDVPTDSLPPLDDEMPSAPAADEDGLPTYDEENLVDDYDDGRAEQHAPSSMPAELRYETEFEPGFEPDFGPQGDWYTDEAGCCSPRSHWLIPPALYSPSGLLGEDLARRITIDGWLEQGFTWNPDSPPDRFNTNVGFNDRANEYQMNQLYVSLAKPVCNDSCEWDIGGRVDLLYGTDYFFTTALGLETHNDGTQRWNRDRGPRADGNAPLYGLAMPQLYADIYAPWGYGTQFRLGHFYTIIGYETVPAVNNFFYSHSYSKLYGEPFTHTGFLGSYNVLPSTAIMAGMVRGWDSWEDINNDQGFLGGVTWDSPDRFASFAYAIYAGNEQNESLGEPNSTLVMFSALLTLRPTDRFTYVLQYDRGYQENVSGQQFQSDADWYSVVQYFLCDINRCWAWGCRYEWFCDEDGTRIETNGQRGDFFECTLGLNWRPNSQLLVRPELRIDWSQTKGPLPYDGQSDSNQLLLATDVIYRF